MSIQKKALLDERKLAWEDIKFRIEYGGWHKKSELKVFEAYFVKGKKPKLHPLESDPIPLVYRLWLAPDQSLESWQSITESFLAGPVAWETDVSIEPSEGDGGGSWKGLHQGSASGSVQIARSLRDSYEILMQLAASSSFHGGDPVVGSAVIPPLGYMGGSERRLFDFMTGRMPGSEGFFYNGKRLFEPSGRLAARYEDLCIWLDGSQPHNPYDIVHYMGGVWFESLTEEYMAAVESDEGIRFYLDCFLKMIARYPESLGSERDIYCRELRFLLNSKPLPELMVDMWAEAKQYRGRIDLNDYMGEPAFYIGDVGAI